MSRTSVLLAITILSKFIGFFRELVLLENVGIGSRLDLFVVLYGISTMTTGVVGICVVTSLTPLAGTYRGQSATLALMREGLAFGIGMGVFALAISCGYLFATESMVMHDALLMAAIISVIVPFAIVAEYQVALFLSRNQRTPVIAGNIIVSLPLVVAMLLYDFDIVGYSLGLAASFAMRAAIFAVLLCRDPGQAGHEGRKVHLFGFRIWRTLAGGSAMLAIGLIYLLAQLSAREFGEGSAASIGYGLKIPMFVLTSVWFVLGTGFFADLLTLGTAKAERRIARLSLLNCMLLLIGLGLVTILREFGYAFLPRYVTDNSQTLRIVAASIPYLPLILFVPVIEMTQRLAVARGAHLWVLSSAGAILAAGLAAQLAALDQRSEDWLIWSPVIASVAGSIVSLVVLYALIRPMSSVEQRRTHDH